MTPWHHAISSAKKFGGKPTDYIEIHNWFDETKQHTGDWTHRALRHHSQGIQRALSKFGHAIMNSENEIIPTKLISEQHVMEDCGYIPTVQDWLKPLIKNPEDWMLRVQKKSTEVLQIQ